jgi:hypothetical protein
MFERSIAILDDRQHTLTIFGGRKEADGMSHAHRLAHSAEHVNHLSLSAH